MEFSTIAELLKINSNNPSWLPQSIYYGDIADSSVMTQAGDYPLNFLSSNRV